MPPPTATARGRRGHTRHTGRQYLPPVGRAWRALRGGWKSVSRLVPGDDAQLVYVPAHGSSISHPARASPIVVRMQRRRALALHGSTGPGSHGA